MALFRHNTNDSQSPFNADDAPAYVAPDADIIPDEEEPAPPASRRRTGVSPRTGRPLRLASIPQTGTPHTRTEYRQGEHPSGPARDQEPDDR